MRGEGVLGGTQVLPHKILDILILILYSTIVVGTKTNICYAYNNGPQWCFSDMSIEQVSCVLWEVEKFKLGILN